MPDAKTPSALALEARDVWKAFERTQALSGVSFGLVTGEVHALVDANGAGKSTFSRIVSGHLQADRGEISIFGEGKRFASAREAIQTGVTMVMQETSLAPDLSVLENIYLSEFGTTGRLSWSSLAARAEAVIDQFGQRGHLPLARPVRDLSAGQRQMVEILKALALGVGHLSESSCARAAPSQRRRSAEPPTNRTTRWRRLGGGWLPSTVRFSGMMMMMMLLLRPAAARFSYRVMENRRH